MQFSLLTGDTVVKAVFDHFRNLGIVGAIFFAAYWVYANTGRSSLWPWMDTVAWVCLSIIGVVLFLMNEIHAYRKLKASGISLAWETLISTVYAFSVLYFVSSFVDLKVAAW